MDNGDLSDWFFRVLCFLGLTQIIDAAVWIVEHVSVKVTF